VTVTQKLPLRIILPFSVEYAISFTAAISPSQLDGKSHLITPSWPWRLSASCV